jgi:hypothetical protein
MRNVAAAVTMKSARKKAKVLSPFPESRGFVDTHRAPSSVTSAAIRGYYGAKESAAIWNYISDLALHIADAKVRCTGLFYTSMSRNLPLETRRIGIDRSIRVWEPAHENST